MSRRRRAPNFLRGRRRRPPDLPPRPPGFRTGQVRPHLHPVVPHLDVLTRRAGGRPEGEHLPSFRVLVPCDARAGRRALESPAVTRGSLAAHPCSPRPPAWVRDSLPSLRLCHRGLGGVAWGTWRRIHPSASPPRPDGSQQVWAVRRGGAGVERLLGAGVSGAPCSLSASVLTAPSGVACGSYPRSTDRRAAVRPVAARATGLVEWGLAPGQRVWGPGCDPLVPIAVASEGGGTRGGHRAIVWLRGQTAAPRVSTRTGLRPHRAPTCRHRHTRLCPRGASVTGAPSSPAWRAETSSPTSREGTPEGLQGSRGCTWSALVPP